MTAMSVLVPLSIAMGLVGLLAFLWSLRAQQYEDLDGAAVRILLVDDEDDAAAATGGMECQPRRTTDDSL